VSFKITEKSAKIAPSLVAQQCQLNPFKQKKAAQAAAVYVAACGGVAPQRRVSVDFKTAHYNAYSEHPCILMTRICETLKSAKLMF
jgi:hypothetical protein